MRKIYFDSGKHPTIALAPDNKTIVEVHEGLYYRIGHIDPYCAKVNWVGDGGTKYDAGEQPAIAIAPDNTVIEVHKGSGNNNLYYRTGSLKEDKIEWNGNTKADNYDGGAQQPAIALASDGKTIVEFHNQKGNSNGIYYRIGTLEGQIIKWKGSGGTYYANGDFPSIAFTSQDKLVLIYQGASDNKLYWELLKLDITKEKEQISRISNGPVRVDSGSHSAVALSPKKDYITVINKRHDDNYLRQSLGVLGEDSISWPLDSDIIRDVGDTNSEGTQGEYPTFIWTQDGTIIIVYQDSDGNLASIGSSGIEPEVTNDYYAVSAQLLKAFVKGGKTSDLVNPILRAALEGKGDFANIEAKATKGINFVEALSSEMSSSIWYQNPPAKDISEPKPELFTMDDAFNTLSMLAFAIPEVGGLVAGGLSVVKGVFDGIDRQEEWELKMNQIKNATGNVERSKEDEIIDDLSSKIELQGVQQTLKEVESHVAKFKEALNTYFLPDNIISVSPNQQHGFAQPGYLRQKNSRMTVLDAFNVKSLLEDDPWNMILQSQNLQSRRSEVDDPELYSDTLVMPPKYSEVTLSTFIGLATTVVSAMLAYAFLLHAPDDLFSMPSDTKPKIRPPYDAVATLRDYRKNGDMPQPDKLNSVADVAAYVDGYKALECIEILDNLLNQFIKRLEGAKAVWQKIIDRLNMVSFANNQPPQRGNYCYLERDGRVHFNIGPMDNPSDDEKLINKLARDVCTTNQFTCTDQTLSSVKYDTFLANFRNFKTRLEVTYTITTSAKDITEYIFTFGIWAAGNKYLIDDWNKNLKYFAYPLPIDNESDNAEKTKGYNDVFWTCVLKNGISDPAQAGFLDNTAARDTVTWMAYILQNYCEKYRFRVDMKNMTNTLEMAQITSQIFKNIKSEVCDKILRDVAAK